MIAEDLLERGFADAAGDYDVPAGAVDLIRAQLAPAVDDADVRPQRWRLHRPTSHGWLVLAAASLVLIIVVAFAVGGGGTNRTEQGGSAASTASRPSPVAGGGVAGAMRQSTTKRAAAAHAPLAAAVPAPAEDFSSATGSTGAGSSAGTGAAIAPSNGGTVAEPITPVPTVPDRIVKTGELDLQVAKGQVSPTLDRITALATLEQGYVADSNTSEGGIAPSGSVTLRVPVGRFEDTVSRARSITGVKVLGLQTSAKDVTSRYVDLQARIKALQATRNTFLDLLAKATTIGETLAVQQHVTDVQTQIEQLQGQLKVLANQSALSTLTVTVDQKVAVLATHTHHKSGLVKAFDRSVSRFVRGIEAIIGVIGPLLLAALLIALFWLAGRFGYRALRRRMV